MLVGLEYKGKKDSFTYVNDKLLCKQIAWAKSGDIANDIPLEDAKWMVWHSPGSFKIVYPESVQIVPERPPEFPPPVGDKLDGGFDGTPTVFKDEPASEPRKRAGRPKQARTNDPLGRILESDADPQA